MIFDGRIVPVFMLQWPIIIPVFITDSYNKRQNIDLTGKKFLTNVFDRQTTRIGPL